jgi:chaperonin GroES
MKTDNHSMRPLHDYVLVEPSAEQTMSRGGIVLPDIAKDKPQEGTVLAAGNGRVASIF